MCGTVGGAGGTGHTVAGVFAVRGLMYGIDQREARVWFLILIFIALIFFTCHVSEILVAKAFTTDWSDGESEAELLMS